MKLRIPLVPYLKFGIPCPRPEILLEVRTRTGDFLSLRFVVDTATDFTTLSLLRAERYGIPFERREENQVPFHGSVGTGVGYLGSLVVRIFGRERTWPCCFTELAAAVPASPEAPSTTRRLPLSLLGRAGVLDDCALDIDAPYLTVTFRNPWHRWWRSLLHALRQRFTGG